MMQQLLHETMARDRTRANDERARRMYARRVAVLRRRQRRVDAARRRLRSLSVR
jgi:hypothetical protein